MAQKRLMPDVVSYSAGLSACEKASQSEEALPLLAAISMSLLTPDAVSYNAAIGAA